MKLSHPVIAGITRDVPDSAAESWIKSGWVPEAVAAEPDWDAANTAFKAKKRLPLATED